ncbi:hypothetical protein REH65_31445 [Saccharopolyspora sp. ID03-671]|uniref:hypothetical protein n=1 Tax=Saccharopolyspora sp. ID03-671 TaxID=3073066 RepID=UPI00324D0558
MSCQGEFSTHRRAGTDVTKFANGSHPAGGRFVDAMTSTGAAGMHSYLDSLQSAGVRLADDLHVVSSRPLTVRHRWMPGPTLLDDSSQSDPTAFAEAIAEIGHWVCALEGTDARIDTNLANFCLENGRPVLVDVLPPLVPSVCPTPVTRFEELFDVLCFDTPVVLDALISYALRALLSAHPDAARALLPVHEEIPTGAPDPGFPALWFHARRALAVRAAKGEVDVASVHEFFALTSVLGFKQLDEFHRYQRIRSVARRLRESQR